MHKVIVGKKKLKRLVSLTGTNLRKWRSKDSLRNGGKSSEEYGKPSVYHATIVIFLEFFAWGLLTAPTITILGKTFPDHTFLMNGLIQGVKGTLSFLSAPLIGALSDVWGRKSFLLVTVFFTCAPIPLLRFNPMWFFAVCSISGVFAVTFSVAFAYVADCTDEEDRSTAYGLVSATFAASLITSPALGAYIGKEYNDNLVVALATSIAVLDLLFILVCVPESLPERMRPASWGAPITWEQADPFASLRKVGQEPTVLLLCIAVFLSYLPEAGQYSCMFLYLKQVMMFSSEDVGIYIAVIGVLSVFAQTFVLTCLKKSIGLKNTILVGLFFQMLQLTWYGLATQSWMMWGSGSLASMASLTYPAISALVSFHADADQQGVVQGIITGIRGLCNGIGPALFGFMFYVFHVQLDENPTLPTTLSHNNNNSSAPLEGPIRIGTGAPFLFGAISVILSLLLAFFIPESPRLRAIVPPRSPTLMSEPNSYHDSDYDSGGSSHNHTSHNPRTSGPEHAPLLMDADIS